MPALLHDGNQFSRGAPAMRRGQGGALGKFAVLVT